MATEVTYEEFLSSKAFARRANGFVPKWFPAKAFPFQRHLIDWSVRLGRCGIFADCGLGKSVISLTFAENIYRHTNGNVLVLTPLAVAPQIVREGEKFGIEVKRTRNGEVHRGINVVNYHRLEKYDPNDFVAVICDESGILKAYGGKTRRQITEFCNKLRFRLLATATPAPNDWEELGNSSEALGNMGRNQMLRTFFIADDDPVGNVESTHHWQLKPHGKTEFWRWIGSWAKALRKPSDLGFKDDGYILPPLNVQQHTVDSIVLNEGFLPSLARGLKEQRAERRRTMQKRCELAASLVPKDRPAILWCHLNPEGDLLERLIPGAVQVAGKDSDEDKEERFTAFSAGQIKTLVTKSQIGGFGLNWQHCADMTFFPSDSFEKYYQSLRRCWRFGQVNPVNVHIVTSQAESRVLSNMLSKERQADEMYNNLVAVLNQEPKKEEESNGQTNGVVEIPSWLNR